jgi:hypothetical protein
MPGSATPPGRSSACDGVLQRVAFRVADRFSARDTKTFVGQPLACAYPCQRFVAHLTAHDA